MPKSNDDNQTTYKCFQMNRKHFPSSKVLLLITLLIPLIYLTKHQNTITPNRRLNWSSSCPAHLLSSLPEPTLPSTPILKKPSYIASFPGSGDKLFSKYLVEMISGLHVGEAAVSPSLYKMEEEGGVSGGMGQGQVFGVRTHFPHTSGRLASWDRNISQAIVILRNPIHAIPSYFNEVYEIRNHLPPGSSKDPQHRADTHTTWIKWRNAQFSSQMMLYRRFVSFWMERHIEDDTSRIFFTYEDLVEWYSGPEEAKRLFRFISSSLRDNIVEMVKDGILDIAVDDSGAIDALVDEAMKNVAKQGDVPCIWKELVAPSQERRLQSDSDYVPYSSSMGGEWDQNERPLTPQNLAALSQMLLELMNRWSRHQRVLNIMAGYHRDVNKLYQDVVATWDDQKEEQEAAAAPNVVLPFDAVDDPEAQSWNEAPVLPDDGTSQTNPILSKNFHIIQASPPHSASTIATNWLIGLFEPFTDYAFMTGTWPEDPIKQSGKNVNIEGHIVTKTHDMDILQMYKKMRPLFDEIFFVLSYQQSDLGTKINEELCQYKNVLCIPFEELLFQGKDELKEMVTKLTAKLKERFGYFFGTSEWLTEKEELRCFRRLQDMLRAKVDMMEQPMDMSDLKFGVHGGGKKPCPPNLVTC